MKRFLNLIVILAVFAGLFGAAYLINNRGRMDCGELSPELLGQGGPWILTGSRVEPGPEKTTETFEIDFDGELYLWLPRGTLSDISGSDYIRLIVDSGELYRIDAAGGAHISVSLETRKGYVTGNNSYIYAGTFEQVNNYINTSFISNYFVRGVCFAVMLTSLFFFLFKRSEKYLLWLAILAFFVGYYRKWKTAFSVLPIMGYMDVMVLDQLIDSVMLYFAMREFMPMNIGRVPAVVISTAFGLPGLFSTQKTPLYYFFAIMFFVVFYSTHIMGILRMNREQKAERLVFLSAWILTVSMRFIDVFGDMGIFPGGDLNLRYRLRGLASVVYVAALFICCYKRYAEKYRRSERMNAVLEEQIREKTKENLAFIRSMIHNIKTPLFSISGYIDLARRSLDRDGAAARRYLDKAQEKAMYSGQLMDNLSLVMRLNTHQLSIEPMPMDLRDAAVKCCETALPLAEKKGIELVNSCTEPMPTVGDQVYIQQVIQNLIDNAVVNTPEGGRVELYAQSSGGKWHLHVKDSGSGVAPGNEDKIFEPGFSKRADTSSTGLGLYISREIMSLHGEGIRLESRPGEGADFAITMPVKAETA